MAEAQKILVVATRDEAEAQDSFCARDNFKRQECGEAVIEEAACEQGGVVSWI